MTGGRQVVRMGQRSLLALAAVWLLLLQVALTGLTAFGHPGSAQAGTDLAGAGGFAAVICTPDGVRPAPAGSDAPAIPHDLSCCLIGCSAGGSQSATPDAAAAFVPPVAASVAQLAVATDRPTAGAHRPPTGARAPPAAA